MLKPTTHFHCELPLQTTHFSPHTDGQSLFQKLNRIITDAPLVYWRGRRIYNETNVGQKTSAGPPWWRSG